MRLLKETRERIGILRYCKGMVNNNYEIDKYNTNPKNFNFLKFEPSCELILPFKGERLERSIIYFRGGHFYVEETKPNFKNSITKKVDNYQKMVIMGLVSTEIKKNLEGLSKITLSAEGISNQVIRNENDYKSLLRIISSKGFNVHKKSNIIPQAYRCGVFIEPFLKYCD